MAASAKAPASCAEAQRRRGPHDELINVRSKVPAARLSGHTAGAAERPEACRKERIRSSRAAATGAEDVQHARVPGSRPLRALWERAERGLRVECGCDVRAMWRRLAHLRAVRPLRHERAVRVPAADPDARLSQGCAQRVYVLRAPHDRRTRDKIRRSLQRPQSIRRSVQVRGQLSAVRPIITSVQRSVGETQVDGLGL